MAQKMFRGIYWINCGFLRASSYESDINFCDFFLFFQIWNNNNKVRNKR